MCSNTRIKNIIKRLKILHKNMPIEEVLKDRGIIVCDISGTNISRGAYNMSKGIQYIFINTSLSRGERLITLAHELGHSILHPDIDTYELKYNNSYYFLNRYESQARLFAAEYLLPDSIINDIDPCISEVGDGKSIYDIANDYEVSEELVVTKLNNLAQSKCTNFSALVDSFIPSNALNY